MTFEARLLMEPYIIENYSKYIDMDKLLDLEEQTKKILSSDILEQKDAVVCTSGVWIVRNFPPQIIIWVKPYLFSFFKYSV